MSEADELEQEFEEFKDKLLQTRDKFINKWMDEEWHKLFNDQNKRHEEFIKKGNEEVNNHSMKVEELKQQKQAYFRELEEKAENLEKLKANLNLFMDRTDDREPSVKKAKTTDCHSESCDKSQEIVDLEKEGALFRENLGFAFKKTAGGRLQFVFTAIDRDDPDAPFYFYVKLDESRKYIDCEPPVPQLNELVKKLNDTNNLSAFVVAMRKAFKSVLLADKEKHQQK